MITIKNDDTIIDIIEKMQSQTSGDIILDFPLGHPVLHNYISLKILKSKVGERKLIIATNDRIGRRIGKRLGIEYSLIKNGDFIKESTQNILMKHNFTFGEYLKFQLHSYIKEIRSSLEVNKKLNTLGKYSKVYSEKTGIYIFLGALISSFLLLLFIYYFAVSKTYISITPEVSIKKEAYNFIFKESINNDILGNNKYIDIKTLSQKIDISEVYASSDIKNNSSKRAQGKVQIFNMLPEEQALIGKTRLQTPDGIVFELKESVTLPPAVQDNFGKLSAGMVEVEVQAQLKDTHGKFTGSRGNTASGTSLILPGLDVASQKDIYALSLEDFSGGVDDFEKMVAQNDIDQSQELFKEKLKNEALKYIKDTIYQENTLNNSKVDILSGGKSIQYGIPEVHVEPGVIAGSLQENFTLTGSISIQAYTYNKESVIQRLKTLIYEKNLEGVEKISHIDESSLRMSEVISSQEKPFEMKATFEIESLYMHDFLHTQNTYITQLRAKVRGLSEEEAVKVLLNDPKISNAKVETRPFFVNTVSSIENNIIFKVE